MRGNTAVQLFSRVLESLEGLQNKTKTTKRNQKIKVTKSLRGNTGAQVVVGSKLDDIFMVMEYMEHDLKALQDSMSKPFTVSEVGCCWLLSFQYYSAGSL